VERRPRSRQLAGGDRDPVLDGAELQRRLEAAGGVEDRVRDHAPPARRSPLEAAREDPTAWAAAFEAGQRLLVGGSSAPAER